MDEQLFTSGLHLLQHAAVHDTAGWTTKKIQAIRELLRRATAHVREHAPSLYSRELVELVFEQPYSRIGNVVSAGIAKRQTASVYMKELCDICDVIDIYRGYVDAHSAISPSLESITCKVSSGLPQKPPSKPEGGRSDFN